MIRKISYTTLFWGVVSCTLLTSACKDEVNLPDQPLDSFTKVYMPQGVEGPVNKVVNISDTLQIVTYGAAFGGYGYPDKDIPVTFSVNNALVAEYNAKNSTDYLVLPAGTYTLSSTSAVIFKGKLSTSPLSILLKTKGEGSMIPLKTYVLPVTMSAQGVAVNEALSTTYFILKAEPKLSDYPLFDRSQWHVIGMSSEEANGEGANNGRAIHALDNVSSTFWHSRWQGGEAPPPHFLTIDMGSARELHGIYLLGRQNDNGGGKPKNMTIETSMDNITWTNAGTIVGQSIQAPQYLWLQEGFPTARYFKITINESYNAGVTHLAELNAF